MATTLGVLENTMWSLHLEGKALCVPAAPIHIPSFPGAARRPPPHGYRHVSSNPLSRSSFITWGIGFA